MQSGLKSTEERYRKMKRVRELEAAAFEKEKRPCMDSVSYYVARYTYIAIRVHLQDCVWLQLNMP